MHSDHLLGCIAVCALQWLAIAAPAPSNHTYLNGLTNSTIDDLGAIRFECFPAPSSGIPYIKYDQCQQSIDAFTARYPPKNSRSRYYTLTHKFKHDDFTWNRVFLPYTSNPNPNSLSCDFILDYTTYPSDRDEVDGLIDVAAYGESLIRKCKRQDDYYGGTMTATFGSWVYTLTLRPFMRLDLVGDNQTAGANIAAF